MITETLNNDKSTYQASYQLFDGWLRPRQTQDPGPGGRLVTDTFYDEVGRAYKVNDVYRATGAPTDTLLVVADGEVNGQAVTVFDRAGRPIYDIFQVAGQEKWRTITSYGGDRVHTNPPDGGVATTLVNDARGRSIELRQYHGGAPSGAYDSTSYEYTPRNELATVTDPAGNTWTYEYDQRGRKIQADDPDAGTTTYTYDDLNQLLSTTDARGVTVSHTYDQIGRTTATYEGDPDTGTLLAQWYWDLYQNGQLAGHRSYYDDLVVTVITQLRDYLYRPLRTTYNVSGVGAGQLAGSYSPEVTYNVDHTLKGTQFPAGGGLPLTGVAYTYDELRRPVAGYEPGGEVYVSDINYHPTGQLAQVGMLAGATHTYRSFEYEQGTNRLTRALTSMATGTLADVAYRYDDAGNVLSIIDDPGVTGGQRDAQCFTYDYLRRLTTAWTTALSGAGDVACAGGPTTTGVGGPAAYWHEYDFDLVGNRTSRTVHATSAPGSPPSDVDTTYTYPTQGSSQPHTLTEETSTSGGTQTAHTSYGYDAAGNTITAERDGNVEALTWDSLGHLESITSGAATSEFFYDAEGNRILRDGPDGLTLFIPGMEIHQPAGTTEVTATRYIDLPGGITYVETTGEPPQYQITDHHGTGALSIDPDTGTVDHRRLDPYGDPRGAPPADWAGDLGFVGGTIDPTGYTHLGAREYDPRTGRFISLDPIMDLTDPQQIHGYTYASNNPATFSDPSGLILIGDNEGKLRAIPKEEGGFTIIDDRPLLSLDQFIGETTGPVEDGVEDAKTLDETANELYYMPYHLLTPYEQWRTQSYTYEHNNPSAGMSLWEFLLELTGVSDAIDCSNLDFGGCGWLAVSLLPINKLGKGTVKIGDAVLDATRAAARFCSFGEDSEVLMANGTTKPMSEIKLGDLVRATDPETGESGTRIVTAVWVHNDVLVDLELEGGAKAITTTEDHPFWNETDQEWQRADVLDLGDLLLTPNGTVTITGLDRTTFHTDTAYNLSVSDLHTYYVLAGDAPVLVHNSGACSAFSGKINNIVSHLTDRDLEAARRELNGEVVARKPDGTPWDHVAEVRDAQRGLINVMERINRRLGNSDISRAERAALTSDLSRASIILDFTEQFVPRP